MLSLVTKQARLLTTIFLLITHSVATFMKQLRNVEQIRQSVNKLCTMRKSFVLN